MPECGEHVGKGTVTYPCSLDRGHDGPHMAREIPRSVREHETWRQGQSAPEPQPVVSASEEADRRHAESGLGQFQGRAETTAERYTENPTAVPGPRPDPNHPGVPDVPTKQRPEDQPLPTVNEETFIQDRVVSDIEARKAVGIQRYGTALQPFNGRDAIQDAYEEAMDLTVYLKQVLVERQAAASAVTLLEGFVRGSQTLDANAQRGLMEAIGLLRAVLRTP